MKFKVNNNALLLTAGIVWILAGGNILRIGIVTWISDKHIWLFKMCEASVVFLIFFGIIFRKLYNKHSIRIQNKNNKNCPFSFFDKKSWLIMVSMITIGILLREYHLLPINFFSFFYTGLSLALIATGFRFIFLWFRRSDRN